MYSSFADPIISPDFAALTLPAAVAQERAGLHLQQGKQIDAMKDLRVLLTQICAGAIGYTDAWVRLVQKLAAQAPQKGFALCLTALRRDKLPDEMTARILTILPKTLTTVNQQTALKNLLVMHRSLDRLGNNKESVLPFLSLLVSVAEKLPEDQMKAKAPLVRSIMCDVLTTAGLQESLIQRAGKLYERAALYQSETSTENAFIDVFTDFFGDNTPAQRLALAFTPQSPLAAVTVPLILSLGTQTIQADPNKTKTILCLVVEAMPYCGPTETACAQQVREKTAEALLPIIATADLQPTKALYALLTMASSLPATSYLESSFRAQLSTHVAPKDPVNFLAQHLANAVPGSLADEILSVSLLDLASPFRREAQSNMLPVARAVLKSSDLPMRLHEAGYYYNLATERDYERNQQQTFDSVMADLPHHNGAPNALAHNAAAKLIYFSNTYVDIAPDSTFKALRRIVNTFGTSPDSSKPPFNGLGFAAAEKILHLGGKAHNAARGEAYLALKAIQRHTNCDTMLYQQTKEALSAMDKPPVWRRVLRALGSNVALMPPQHKPA